MTDFDDMVKDSSGIFTSGFSSSTTGTYYANGRPALEDELNPGRSNWKGSRG